MKKSEAHTKAMIRFFFAGLMLIGIALGCIDYRLAIAWAGAWCIMLAFCSNMCRQDALKKEKGNDAPHN